MKIFSTSALSSSIIVASLLISPISKGEEYTYNPSADLGGKFSAARNITEFNYMHPLFDSGDILPIIDLKLKLDNYKSKEINLGFVLRHNYEDKAILGAYAYFDHRQTASKFSVSALTAGVEVLSKYVDARANIYLPQSKKKKVAHRNISVERQGTSIFVLSGGHTYESALKGYDIEIGTPIFGFSDELNEKIGTKIHVARYSFKGKNTKLVAGTRFRLEQDIATFWSGNNSYNFYMNAETQFDAVRKRQNFMGLGLKVIFGDKVNIGKKHANKLDHRMMETIIRDVDQVVLPHNENAIVNNFFQGSQKIDKHYYVASYVNGAAHEGDGTEANPFSFEQLKKIDCTDALVVVTKVGGKKMTMQEIDQLKDIPNLAGHGHDIHLNAAGHEFVVQDKDGVSINAQGALTTNLLGESRHKEVKLQKLYAIVNAQKIAHKMVNRFHERKAARKAGAKRVAGLIEAARVAAAATKLQSIARKIAATKVVQNEREEAERVEAERVAKERVDAIFKAARLAEDEAKRAQRVKAAEVRAAWSMADAEGWFGTEVDDVTDAPKPKRTQSDAAAKRALLAAKRIAGNKAAAEQRSNTEHWFEAEKAKTRAEESNVLSEATEQKVDRWRQFVSDNKLYLDEQNNLNAQNESSDSGSSSPSTVVGGVTKAPGWKVMFKDAQRTKERRQKLQNALENYRESLKSNPTTSSNEPSNNMQQLRDNKGWGEVQSAAQIAVAAIQNLRNKYDSDPSIVNDGFAASVVKERIAVAIKIQSIYRRHAAIASFTQAKEAANQKVTPLSEKQQRSEEKRLQHIEGKKLVAAINAERSEAKKAQKQAELDRIEKTEKADEKRRLRNGKSQARAKELKILAKKNAKFSTESALNSFKKDLKENRQIELAAILDQIENYKSTSEHDSQDVIDREIKSSIANLVGINLEKQKIVAKILQDMYDELHAAPSSPRASDAQNEQGTPTGVEWVGEITSPQSHAPQNLNEEFSDEAQKQDFRTKYKTSYKNFEANGSYGQKSPASPSNGPDWEQENVILPSNVNSPSDFVNQQIKTVSNPDGTRRIKPIQALKRVANNIWRRLWSKT